jgi:uncharacterized protein YraI
MVLFSVLHRCPIRRRQAPALLLIFSLVIAACGPASSAPADTAGEPLQIRSAHPTFTPTPRGQAPAAPVAEAPAAPVGQDPPVDTAEADPPQPAQSEVRARLTVNTDLVNLREGPGTNSTIITILQKGAAFDIIGKNVSGEWWFVCCFEDKAGWVTAEFADVEGAVDQVPVVDESALAPAPTTAAVAVADPPAATTAPAAAPTAAPAEPTATPEALGGPVSTANAAYEFELAAHEQFPETNVMRIFLYVFDDKAALAGYSLSVRKDGAELPVNDSSFGPNHAFSWPVADPRQRAQNLKIEFPGVDPAGVWEVQLTLDGAPAGPPATFTLVAGDLNRELYVRYKRP